MAEDPLGDFGSTLSKDVGGVPVWVIGTGGGLVIAVGYWLYKRNQGNAVVQNVYDPNSADSSSNTDPTNNDFGLPNGPGGDWLAGNPTSTAFPVGGSALPEPITNGQWARQAIDGLLSKGDDPTLVNNAISKYIAGTGLTAAEKAVVNQALTIYGSLPEGAKTIIDFVTPVIPGPVRNIHTTAAYKNSVTVDWDPPANGGQVGYAIKVNGAAKTSPLYSGPYNVGNLKAGTSYTVSIAARNAASATGPYTDYKITTKK
jgi:hypothetical protein